MNAYGKIIFKVSKFKGTFGIKKLGRLPLILARSPTLGISIFKVKVKMVVKNIATNVEGTIFVICGQNQMINIVNTTNIIE